MDIEKRSNKSMVNPVMNNLFFEKIVDSYFLQALLLLFHIDFAAYFQISSAMDSVNVSLDPGSADTKKYE